MYLLQQIKVLKSQKELQVFNVNLSDQHSIYIHIDSASGSLILRSKSLTH